MQAYNPKKWFEILFQFRRSDTLRKLLPLILIIAGYSWLIAYLELSYFNFREHPFLRNIPQMHNILGFAISLILVFRTNTAYDRWWEGRKQWGELINSSRNLASKLQAILQPSDAHNRDFFKRMIPLYASVLRDHLRSEATRLALDESDDPEIRAIFKDKNRHVPNQVARLLYDRVVMLRNQGVLTDEQVLFLNPELMSFTNICGACERIKNTPIPHSYSSFIKKLILVYVMTLPIGYVFTLEYLVVPVVAIVFYALGSLELIAEEIEDPFGRDDNDLPMDKMAENIKKHIEEIL